MIKAQQLAENSPLAAEELKAPDSHMSQVRAAYPSFKDHLMFLLKTEICHEVLLETGVGKTLKWFKDYCVCYQEEMPELRTLVQISETILQKWKNFVLNTIFDEQKDNISEFIK